MIMQFLTVLLAGTAYALMRYVVFGDVSPMHVPAYIINKSIALTAAVSLVMASAGQARIRRDVARFWWKACSHLIFVHVLLSVGLFSDGYYPKFFEGDRMNLSGEAMLFLGVMAAYCFWRLGSSDPTQSARRTLTVLSRILVAGHLLVMGYGGWLQVRKWHGGLPPITLLSFLLVMFSLYAFLRAKETGPVSSRVASSKQSLSP